MDIQQYDLRMDTNKKLFLDPSTSFVFDAESLNAPDIIYSLFCNKIRLDSLTEEYVFMLALNTRCYPVGLFEISHGIFNAALVQPREILIRALLVGASDIILVHSHPSGNPTPSAPDDSITKRVLNACNLIGVNLLDHVIVGSEGYFSYNEGSSSVILKSPNPNYLTN